MKLLIAFFVLFSGPIAAAASWNLIVKSTVKNYYVSPTGSDSNDGSSTRPWKTINHAANALSLGSDGATVHVAPGTYALPAVSCAGLTAGVCTKRSGASSTARLVFVSDVKWGAKITAKSAYEIWQNTGNYVDIVGFDVSGANYVGIGNYGSYARMIGNNVHDILIPVCTVNGGAGIDNANYSAHDDDVIGNIVHDVRLPAVCTTHPNGMHGVYHANLRGKIMNNIIYNNAAQGILLWHAANQVVISSNTIFNNGAVVSTGCIGGGILVGDGDSPGGIVNSGTIVSNNIVFKNNCSGIREYGSTGVNTYTHNLLYGNYYLAYRLTTSKADPAPVLANPQFVYYNPSGTGDYHLMSTSPAINKGTSLAVPGYDMDWYPRPYGGAFDIGAYERQL